MSNFLKKNVPHFIYQIASDVAMEGFEDGALVFKVNDRKLVEVNQTLRDVLGYTDGKRNVFEVAKLLAQEQQIPEGQALDDVMGLYDQMVEQNIVNQVEPSQRKDGTRMTQVSALSRYLCNPDVVLREEDEDGGLLFNPDTNQLKVLNSTGLFIWKQLIKPQELSVVLAAIQQAFEDVPPDEVLADAQSFLQDLMQSGFIGTVEPD